MKIKHTNGTFWNDHSNCFGAECAATIYTDHNDLPLQIETNGRIELELWDSISCGVPNIYYYIADAPWGSDPVAHVVSFAENDNIWD